MIRRTAGGAGGASDQPAVVGGLAFCGPIPADILRAQSLNAGLAVLQILTQPRPPSVRGFLFFHLSYSDQEPPYRRDVEYLHGFRDGGLLVWRFNNTNVPAEVGDAPAGHHSPPGMASRPDQSSIVPGASFQFGRTSIRLFRAPHFAHFTLLRNHGTGVSPG